MLKKLTAVLFALMLTFSCLPAAVAEAQPAETGSHILVVYFSATGTTKGVAEKLAEGLSAETERAAPPSRRTIPPAAPPSRASCLT